MCANYHRVTHYFKFTLATTLTIPAYKTYMLRQGFHVNGIVSKSADDIRYLFQTARSNYQQNNYFAA